MQVVTLEIQLEITNGLTLKDKRQVIRSLLDRIRRKFNISAAEVGELDSVRYATIAIAAVANDHVFLDEVMAKVANLIESEPRVAVLTRNLEFL